MKVEVLIQEPADDLGKPTYDALGRILANLSLFSPTYGERTLRVHIRPGFINVSEDYPLGYDGIINVFPEKREVSSLYTPSPEKEAVRPRKDFVNGLRKVFPDFKIKG